MDQRKYKPLWLPACLLLITALLLAGSTYAWLCYRDYAKSVKLQMTRINTEVWIYTANDTNLNGVPDLSALPSDTAQITDENGETPTNELYYTENYDFTFSSRCYAMSVESGNIAAPTDLPALYPSQLYTFKFMMQNKSYMSNLVAFRYGDREAPASVYGDGAGEDPVLLAMLYVRVGRVQADGSVVFGEFRYLAESLTVDGDVYTFHGLDITPDRLEIDGMTEMTPGKCDCWFQIGIAPYELLTANSAFQALGLTRADYDSIQGTSARLPSLYVYFDIDVEG